MFHALKLSSIALTLIAVLVASITPMGKAASAMELVSADSSHMAMEVRRGELLKLPRAAATVFVSDPTIADVQVKSPRLIYVFAKQPGDTTLFAVDKNENVLANVDIQVTHNISRMQQTVRELYPDADVAISSMDGTIIVEGNVESATIAENLHRLAVELTGDPAKVLMRVGITAPNQVNLRVRVAEVSRDIDKQFGFNWDLAGTGGGVTVGMLTANPLAAALTQNTFTLGASIGAFDINAVLDALEDEGMISILAEPNLTAMSGETASFLAGGEFPILVPGGDNGPSIEFKKFGISLAFTPTLVGTNRVNLHVSPEVSQLSNTNSISLGGYEIPALTTRRAETTVELGSGQSFAIAGPIQNNTTHDISKFPGLGDIPVLGTLFRSDRFQREETELVLIVTPYLVRPANQRLATPLDEFTPPNDEQRLKASGTHVPQSTAGQPRTIDRKGNSLIGPVGFVIDE